MDELYHKYRPTSFKTVIGQPDAVKVLSGLFKAKKFPHATLFTGASGCGKTTLARICVTKLDCAPRDFKEYNSASLRGIDTIRTISDRISSAPYQTSRVWLIDEAHKLTNDAQNALLKMLEDQPKHAYFMLCTTDPGKLIAAVKNRCTEVKVVPLKTAGMMELLKSVLTKEKATVSDEVLERIVDAADGAARKALVLLQQVIHLATEEDQLNAILNSDAKAAGLELYKALLNPRSTWAEMSKLLKSYDGEPEDARRFILACASNALLGAGKSSARAYLIINCFRDHYYDCGRSGLVSSCYEVISSK